MRKTEAVETQNEKRVVTLPSTIIISVLTGLFMFSIGFGTSQMTAIADLKSVIAEQRRLDDRDNTAMKRMDDLDEKREKLATQMDQRIFAVVGLVEKVIDQNTTLIATLKANQNHP